MEHPLKNFLLFNISVCVKVDNNSLGLEIYIQVLQTCLLLEGCPRQCAGSVLELIAVGQCEGWLLGIQTRRIHAIGATPLKKRHHHQRKTNLMSNIIKSNANHAVMCVAC